MLVSAFETILTPMRDSLQQFVALVLQESLKRDIERHSAARMIYRLFVRKLESIKPTKEAAEGAPYLMSPDKKLLAAISPDRSAARAEMLVSALPDELAGPLGKEISSINIAMSTTASESIPDAGAVYNSVHNRVAMIEVVYIKNDLDLADKSPEDQMEIIVRAFKLKQSFIVHELSHMVDDLHLMGSEKFRRTTNFNIDPEKGGVKIDKKYWNLGLEVNARWSQAIDALGGMQYTDYDPGDSSQFNSWLYRARHKMHLDTLTPAKKRKFIGRLWDFFKSGPHPVPAHDLEESAEDIVEGYKKHLDGLMGDSGGRRHADLQRLGTFAGYFESVLRDKLKDGRVEIEGTWNAYSKENTKRILQRAAELAKTIEKKFERDFANVARLHPEEID